MASNQALPIWQLIERHFFALQYGSEEFPQDPPRFTSPKMNSGLYGDSYFMGN